MRRVLNASAPARVANYLSLSVVKPSPVKINFPGINGVGAPI